MNRRSFLQSALGAAAGLTAAAQPAAQPPNIVYIIADDLGYGELGCQGFTNEIPTPQIDSIARNGVRFTSGYVSCPVCSPTRAGLNTGRYQQRFGHEFNPGPEDQAAQVFGLPLTEVTLANRLKELGYATGMVGKWHLGYRPEYHPMKRGFDEFFGFLGGAHPYLSGSPRDAILRGTEKIEEKEYLTDAFAREATAFIGRRAGRQPFFLYLTFNAVHNPLQSIDKYTSRFPRLSGRRQTYAAMQSAMDDAVGAVLASLRKAGVFDNTLLVFHSDNGGPTLQTTSGNGTLRGYKGQVLEGGIRVPFLMQWPARLPKTKVFDQPVIALDVFPTAVAAAGGKPGANLDGANLLPHLTGAAKTPPHDQLYWRFGEGRAVRQGDWKMTWLPGEAPALYNLASDIGESKDLAGSNGEKLKELQAAYQAWDAQLAKPLWSTRGQGAGRAGKKGGRKKR